MHIVSKVLIALVLLLGVIFMLSRRKDNPRIESNRPATAHTYYYYPKANFYYDSTDGNYICWDSTGSEWKDTDQLPLQQVDIGKRVRIGESMDPVWKDNAQHRLIYSVSLYSEPEDFKKKDKPVSTVDKKPDSSTIGERSEKKSGVKKFFERIFPPKKKKDKS